MKLYRFVRDGMGFYAGHEFDGSQMASGLLNDLLSYGTVEAVEEKEPVKKATKKAAKVSRKDG